MSAFMAYPLLIAPEAPPNPSPEEVELRCLELESVLAEAAGADTFEDLADFAILDLRGEGLTALPESFGLLEALQGLSLCENHLSSLPDSFGQLRQLQDLNLSNNRIDFLPAAVGELRKLEELDLSGNALAYLPQLPKLSKLARLSLARNRFVGAALPSELGRLGRLQQLDVSQNQLSSLPSAITRLSRLEVLRAFGNCLKALPQELGRLQKLQELDVRQNLLTDLPTSVCSLVSLTSLDASENHLHAVPEDLGQLQKLQTLLLSNNDLSRLPLSLLQLRKLGTLQIASNPKLLLEGSAGKLSAAGLGLAILAKFGALQSLKAPGGGDYLPTLKKHLEQEKLDLRDLRIHALPPDVGSLTKLRELRVGSNELEALPGSICGLSKLQILDVKCNKLAGLPRDLGQLKSLQELDVSANLLLELPASLGELAKLTRLDVSQNQLPLLPETITDLAALCTLNLRSNPVTELPKRLDELQALKSLDISSTPLGKSLLLPLQGHCPTRRTLYLMNKYDALQTIRLEKTQSSALPDGMASWGQGPPPKPPPGNSARHSRTGQAPGGRAGKDSWGYSCFDGGPEDFHIFPRRSAAEEAGDDPFLRQVLQDIEHQLEQCLESSKRQKVFRSLLRQWHPDKRREDEELATRVFQWLQTMK